MQQNQPIRMLTSTLKLFLLMFVFSSNAKSEHQSNSGDSEFSIGLALFTQDTAHIGVGSETHLVPFLSYQGEKFETNFNSMTYSLFNTNNFEITLEGELRFDGYDADDSSQLFGMEDRDMALDSGFGISHQSNIGQFKIQAITDISNKHNGYELRTSYEKPMKINNWTIVPSVSVGLLSDSIVDYYYGVESSEVTEERPAFEGKSALVVSGSIFAGYHLSDHHQLIFGASYTNLNSDITLSPIVERGNQSNYFTGWVYTF